jgi:hypothetical protein
MLAGQVYVCDRHEFAGSFSLSNVTSRHSWLEQPITGRLLSRRGGGLVVPMHLALRRVITAIAARCRVEPAARIVNKALENKQKKQEDLNPVPFPPGNLNRIIESWWC